jgi:hypothetical protein
MNLQPPLTTHDTIDYEPFAIIEQQEMQKRRVNELTKESHPNLAVIHKTNTVSFLTKVRRIFPDLSIQAILPIGNVFGIGYFEVRVIQLSLNGTVAIGVANVDYSNISQPGWDKISYGYHSDDGMKFHNSGTPCGHYGEPFGVGDTVGCGVNYNDNTIFYTKNGKYLGTAHDGIDERANIPTVGLDHASVQVIFDESKFVFDIGKLREEEKQKMLIDMEYTNCREYNILDIIKDYLHHQGYEKTYSVLDQSSTSNNNNDQILIIRGMIRECIMSSNTRKALDLVRELPVNQTVLQLLHSQIFIEYVQQQDIESAIAYSQVNLGRYNEPKDLNLWFNMTDLLGLLGMYSLHVLINTNNIFF